ncbi:AraC family transcriptional regulator [Sphingobacterium spiritivorum]|uniref:Transcriptional regulator, AraC family n=1 Tax=Sphingobacterium spiritivorum ATCC 33861 TaxID=525373 RepID=D7VS84_SPHSI|nr:AraC family transcriptional regulator [Sphingobacterium spiritivorum]EFK56635.1 transcriptional regulator, AraC family [Sphingobacterium spiritivorum ATCC 33861]QQT35318.1 helix-turn-helix domain-containing protein [Sphingobacterium spiritivorum]WQD36238.1 AraC family transcriptional regulator [Sphingobacterium spiritivorum]SUJ04948.1 L-rhamnose operon regulatory protein rhaS [Sphingobacterium spiritivorum]
MKAQFIELSPPSEKTIHIKLVDQNFLSNPLHFHELCELVLILESYGKRIVGNHVASFEAGDMVLMGPNVPHIWRNDDVFLNPLHEERAKAIVIYFPADFLLTLTDDQSTIYSMQHFIKKAQRGLRFYGKVLEKASHQIKSLVHKQSFSRITGFLNLIELLYQTHECENLASIGYKPTFGEQDTNRINNVYIYVMQNFREEVSLSMAAEIVNMTPNAFCRFFKRHTQKSFSKFVNEMRVGHACKLLMNRQLSISEICYQSGYQNLTNFNKFFKMIMQKSPREYRKDMDV